MLLNHGVTPEQVPFHLAAVPCQVTVLSCQNKQEWDCLQLSERFSDEMR